MEERSKSLCSIGYLSLLICSEILSRTYAILIPTFRTRRRFVLPLPLGRGISTPNLNAAALVSFRSQLNAVTALPADRQSPGRCCFCASAPAAFGRRCCPVTSPLHCKAWSTEYVIASIVSHHVGARSQTCSPRSLKTCAFKGRRIPNALLSIHPIISPSSCSCYRRAFKQH